MGFTVDQKAIEKYEQNGFTLIKNFLTQNEVQEIKSNVDKYIKENVGAELYRDVTNSKEKVLKNKLLSLSVDKIIPFIEEDAFDESGNLTRPINESLNKLGLAVYREQMFLKVIQSQKVIDVLGQVSPMKCPVVCENLITFKNPKIGSEIYPHQDGTYMYCEPLEGSLIGFWIALDAATVENGCLEFIPGSHKGELYERFIRIEDPNSDDFFKFENTGNGKLPEFPPESFVSVPCNPGDLILIHSKVIHQSGKNLSANRRMSFTFHIYDSTTKWSEKNFIQPTIENVFPKLID